MKTSSQFDCGFAAGIAVAGGILAGAGETTHASEVLRASGLTTRASMKAAGVEKYDLDMLRPIFKQLARRGR